MDIKVPKQNGMKNHIKPAIINDMELFFGEVVELSCQ